MLRAPLIASCCATVCLCFAQTNSKSDSPGRLISLNVAAVDGTGAPVTDLKETDLRVFEDGKARPVVFFRFTGATSPIAPVDKGWFANSPLPPATVVLLDAWNDGMLSATRSWNILNAALDHIDPGTQLYVYFLTNQGDLLAIQPIPGVQADPSKPIAHPPAELRAKFEDASRKLQGLRDNNAQDPVVRSSATFRALNTLFARMAVIGGRKSLIWMTSGVPLHAQMIRLREVADFTPQVKNLSAAAVRAGVAIYPVNQVPVGASLAATTPARATLQMFADLTGGRFYGTDQIEPALAGVAADGRATYRVAFEPASHEAATKEHKLRLESRLGVRLFALDGFTGDNPAQAADDAESARFQGERSGPFDAAEIRLRVAMSRDQGAPSAHFEIRADPADVFVTQEGGHRHAELSVMMAFYAGGVLKQMTNPARLNLDLTESQWDDAVKNGISIPEDAPLGGDIQSLRVMVFDRKLLTLGSVTIPVQ